ncbi:MAG TPA: hypothetical protein VI072_09350 [Polyangiaceae bacterium]
MVVVYAEGGNYRIELDQSTAYCRVWSRPDVDSQAGASFALEKIAHFQALARGQAERMILDLMDAPPVAGPKTQEALGAMLASWEAARRPIALVVGDNKVQLLQLKRLTVSHAPHYGRVFSDLDLARDWLSTLQQGDA